MGRVGRVRDPGRGRGHGRDRVSVGPRVMHRLVRTCPLDRLVKVGDMVGASTVL